MNLFTSSKNKLWVNTNFPDFHLFRMLPSLSDLNISLSFRMLHDSRPRYLPPPFNLFWSQRSRHAQKNIFARLTLKHFRDTCRNYLSSSVAEKLHKVDLTKAAVNLR